MNGVSHFDNGRRLGRRAAFVLLVCANVLMMATASAPSPIHPLYRERWGFSVTMLTVIFAVYVAGLLGALLTVGSLSDHLGRRPVLVAALLVAAASTAIFWAAGGVGSLLIAREARNLAPLAADIDHTVAAALPISGLTAWQGLFDHAHLTTGQTVLIHGGNAFVYAYVPEDAVHSQLEGEPMRTCHQGENWIEQPGAHHVATENASNTEPAELLVVFVSTTGEQLKTDDPHQ